MNLNGANLYLDGINANELCRRKLRKITKAVKSLSPSSTVSLRLLKKGKFCEGLLWAKADERPIGVYKHGESMAQVLDMLYANLKKQTTRIAEKESSNQRPESKASDRYADNTLRPVTLFGLIEPPIQSITGEIVTDYKLVTPRGVEYTIVVDEEWRGILENYIWEEVKLVALLNVHELALIPQRVYPKGPTGENVVDLGTREDARIQPSPMNEPVDPMPMPLPKLSFRFDLPNPAVAL